MCNIKAQSHLAKVIKEAKLIIWDEIFSVHRHNIEAVERTLRDLMNTEEPWGGKVVILGGDPRQTPPIVKKGGRPQIVRACIQSSPLFSKMKQYKLSQNMRTDKEEVDFASYLLKIGEGREDIKKKVGQIEVLTATVNMHKMDANKAKVNTDEMKKESTF